MKIQERNAIASRSMTTSGNVLNTAVLNGMNMIETIKSTGSERSFYNMWRESQLQGIQLFLGAYFVLHGSFTLGSMALFQGMNSMNSSLNNCITAVSQCQLDKLFGERV